MTASPVSPVVQQEDSTGHAEAEGAQEEDAESGLSWDPEEALFDGNGSDISDLTQGDWDQMETEAAQELAKEEVAPREQEDAQASGKRARKQENGGRKLKRRRKPARDQFHRPAARPTRMSYAELDAHKREGHVNYHPGCEFCVAGSRG